MQNRGTINRRTGKTTPRHKAKTHWGAGARARSSATSATPKKAGASAASKSK